MHYKGTCSGEDMKILCRKICADNEMQAIFETKPTIYMTGISGMSVGMALACKHGLDYAVLRKPGERSHGDELQGVIPEDGEILIVDDFVNSGQTIVRMLAEAGLMDEAERVTVLLYDQSTPPVWRSQRRAIDDGKCPYGFGSDLDRADKAVTALESINWVTL